MENLPSHCKKLCYDHIHLFTKCKLTGNGTVQEDSLNVTARPELLLINRVLSLLPPVFILDYQTSRQGQLQKSSK